MSFADILNQEQKKLEENSGNNEKVQYPETKHKRLFFTKQEKELLIQILPSADLYSGFAAPVRKIFLNAKSSGGKDINSNFTLDPDNNPGSLLEQKIAEWQDRKMIPDNWGQQQKPKRLYLVNAVRVIQVNGQWVQERDEHGNLVVRVFEVAQSGYQNLITKLRDPLYNVSGTELSFMDPNRPSPIKITKPPAGQMQYAVEVYTSITLPPLGQGWESQLEDLAAQAVPTERLENGLQWVQAFIDMKEGRKPQNQNQGNDQGGAQAPQSSPFTAPQSNPYAQQQPNPYAQQQPNPYAQQQPNPYAQQQPSAAPQQQYQQQQQPTNYGMVQDNLPSGMDIDAGLSNLPPATQSHQPPAAPPAQQQPAAIPQQNQTIPTQNSMPAAPPQQPQTPPQSQQQIQPQSNPGAPAHNSVNSNGLNDIDAMLEAELNGGM